MKICICSSMTFYTQFKELQKELEKLGHEVLAPDLEIVSKTGDGAVGNFFESSGGVDAFGPDHEIWEEKGRAIKKHFGKIDVSEAVLIVNYEKKGIENYIGGNTFLEIGYAFGQGKKIFILNEFPEHSAYKEEIFGMQPVVLHGDITKIS
jgi:nucleoside 2-deoxyribosyltransferase